MIKVKYPGCFFLQYLYHEYMCIKKNSIVLFLFFIFGFTFCSSVKVKAFDFTQPTEVIDNIGASSESTYFIKPVDVYSDSLQNIYVSDQALNKIFMYDQDLATWNSFGSYGSGSDQLNYPTGITADSSGNIYVADTNNGRVQIYNTQEERWSSLGSLGYGLGFFKTPTQVSLDSQNNVYVYDTYYRTIQKYSPSSEEWSYVSIPSLNYLTSFYVAVNDDIYLFNSGNTNPGVHKYTSLTQEWSFVPNNNLSGIVHDLLVDENNNIYISTGSSIGKYDTVTERGLILHRKVLSLVL